MCKLTKKIVACTSACAATATRFTKRPNFSRPLRPEAPLMTEMHGWGVKSDSSCTSPWPSVAWGADNLRLALFALLERPTVCTHFATSFIFPITVR